jgi:hypothetical protein
MKRGKEVRAHPGSDGFADCDEADERGQHRGQHPPEDQPGGEPEREGEGGVADRYDAANPEAKGVERMAFT